MKLLHAATQLILNKILYGQEVKPVSDLIKVSFLAWKISPEYAEARVHIEGMGNAPYLTRVM